MANYIYIFTICLVVATLAQLVAADRSTLERIKKHQEWLKLHNKHKSDRVKYTKWKSTFELPNLWRINKTVEGKQNSSINEVYAENETSSANSNIIGNGNDKMEPTMASQLRSVSGPSKSQQEIRFDSAVPETTPTSTTSTTSTSTITPELKSLIAEEPTLPTTIEDIPSTTTSTTTTTTASTSTRRPKPKMRLFPRWVSWTAWSECSRTCGGGVKHQIRKCIDRDSTTGRTFESDTCVGLSKRYQVCNDLPCETNDYDIRADQCSAYDKLDFQGEKYRWEPYIKDDAECELNCKPLGMKYFATMNDTIIDGTPCQRPAEYYRSKSTYASRAMCVDGICKVNVS